MTVAVRALRAFRVRGDLFLPGTVVRLGPLDAHAVLGKCELVDPLDIVVVKEAVQESNRSALLMAGRHRTTDDTFGPWQRR